MSDDAHSPTTVMPSPCSISIVYVSACPALAAPVRPGRSIRPARVLDLTVAQLALTRAATVLSCRPGMQLPLDGQPTSQRPRPP